MNFSDSFFFFACYLFSSFFSLGTTLDVSVQQRFTADCTKFDLFNWGSCNFLLLSWDLGHGTWDTLAHVLPACFFFYLSLISPRPSAAATLPLSSVSPCARLQSRMEHTYIFHGYSLDTLSKLVQ